MSKYKKYQQEIAIQAQNEAELAKMVRSQFEGNPTAPPGESKYEIGLDDQSDYYIKSKTETKTFAINERLKKVLLKFPEAEPLLKEAEDQGKLKEALDIVENSEGKFTLPVGEGSFTMKKGEKGYYFTINKKPLKVKISKDYVTVDNINFPNIDSVKKVLAGQPADIRGVEDKFKKLLNKRTVKGKKPINFLTIEKLVEEAKIKQGRTQKLDPVDESTVEELFGDGMTVEKLNALYDEGKLSDDKYRSILVRII